GSTGPQGSTGSQGPQGAPGTPNWKGAWSGATTYQPGDAVQRSGRSYVSKTTNTGSSPSPNGTVDWDIMAWGFRWRGAGRSAATYEALDIVKSAGSSWTVPAGGAVASGGNPPESNAAWALYASKGDVGATGAQGIQGPQGNPGADSTVPGPQGPQGPSG